MTVTMTRVENQTCGAAVKLPSYIAGHTKHRVCSAMIFSMRGGGDDEIWRGSSYHTDGLR